jgi:hypothetical protein
LGRMKNVSVCGVGACALSLSFPLSLAYNSLILFVVVMRVR